MKLSHIIIMGIAVLTTSAVAAQGSVSVVAPLRDTTVCGLTVHNVQMQRSADAMNVAMNLALADFNLTWDRVSVFAPLIVNEADTLRLQPVGLYGRTRWFQYLRHYEMPAGGSDEQSIRWSERPESFDYTVSVPYEEWMNGAELMLERCDYGCCQTLLDSDIAGLTNYREIYYSPVFRYVQPIAAGVKTRELSGRSYIDFPVNRTELYPSYRNNPVELSKIIATIDSVRNDSDVTVKRITIKGWASPESSWENNTRLAKGRTATLKQYVQNLYKFPEGFIETDYYPEDWFGLRDFVETSNLPHRAEILALIDDPTIEPDPKELKLKTTYPDEYRFLLSTVYPGLRHSDYTIEYTIRQFSDPAEIAQMMRTQPQKLSLDEMYVLAQTLEPGSDEYNEVFEIAVRMYPNDETANLNAANVAMGRGDLAAAERYLSKAGDSTEADYARGVLKGLQGDYNGALRLMKSSTEAGLTGTEETIGNLEEVSRYSGK